MYGPVCYSVLLLWCLWSVLAVEYVCEESTVTTYKTEKYYPSTIVPQNSDIPITLGINNYLYKEGGDAIYHDIDVRVLDTYFDGLYLAYPAVTNASSVFKSRYRDNLNDVFRIRYATDPDASCLGSHLIQFKMIFIKDDALYEYYLGNCNVSEVMYGDFGADSLCISYDFACYQRDSCTGASYDAATSQAAKLAPELVHNGALVAKGHFPSLSLKCLDGRSCELQNYPTKTYHYEETSAQLVIDTTTAATTTESILVESHTPANEAVVLRPRSLSIFLLFLFTF